MTRTRGKPAPAARLREGARDGPGIDAEDQARHAIARARERYGIDLSREDFDGLCELIRRHEAAPRRRAPRDAIYVRDHSRVRSLWRIWFANRWLEAVYEKRRRRIVTFLPPGTIKTMR